VSGGEVSALPHVGTYSRRLRVGLEVLLENVLDWEHLSFLHGSSFSAVECLEQGDWGWRARVDFQPAGAAPALVQEVRLDRPHRRWINRTLEGPSRGTEVWSIAVPLGPDQTEVIVDFFQPGVEPEGRESMARAWRRLWDRLYDEDERVMRGQEREARAEGEARYRAVEIDGERVVHATRCPHRGASLADCPVEDGVVTCPFHGYRFDARTGKSVDGRGLRLAPAPQARA